MSKVPFFTVVGAAFSCPSLGTRLDEMRGVEFKARHYENLRRIEARTLPFDVFVKAALMVVGMWFVLYQLFA